VKETALGSEEEEEAVGTVRKENEAEERAVETMARGFFGCALLGFSLGFGKRRKRRGIR
jgi:hypothetical protein